MANYGVVFNNSGKVIIPNWVAGDYTIQVKFTTPSTLATDGLLGNVGSDSYLALFSDGKIGMRHGSTTDYLSPTGLLVVDTPYTLDLVRTGTNLDFTLSDDGGVVHAESSTCTTTLFSITWIGATQTLMFDGVIDGVDLDTTGDIRTYLSTVNTGSNWTETTSSQDGTLDGLATDGSQWTLAAGPPAPSPTLTTDPLKNNTGTLLASVSGLVMAAYSMTTGALVARQESLTSDASGVLVMEDASIVTATEYRVVVTNGTGDGVDRITSV